jgi:KDO2-lipid IV(A) lauroyltransferase
VLAERLAQGYVVPLLADRDLSARGVEVRFFGGRTRMPAGPALLAMRTGAPLYAVAMWFEADGSVAELRGPIDVPGPDEAPLDVRVRLVTQRIADALAAGIAEYPQDWHMLQRLWLDDGPADRDGDDGPADRDGDGAAPGAGAPPTSTVRS